MELFLNLLWLAICGIAVIAVPRRSTRVLLTLLCAAAILFPIVSVSDDLNLDRDSLEAAPGVIVTPTVLVVAMVVLARLDPIRIVPPTMAVTVSCDPRSPPRS